MIHSNTRKIKCGASLRSDLSSSDPLKVSCPSCLEYLHNTGIIVRGYHDSHIWDFFAAVDNIEMADRFFVSYKDEHEKGLRNDEEFRVIRLQYLDFIKGRALIFLV